MGYEFINEQTKKQTAKRSNKQQEVKKFISLLVYAVKRETEACLKNQIS
jgi:hypothetical protein